MITLLEEKSRASFKLVEDIPAFRKGKLTLFDLSSEFKSKQERIDQLERSIFIQNFEAAIYERGVN